MKNFCSWWNLLIEIFRINDLGEFSILKQRTSYVTARSPSLLVLSGHEDPSLSSCPAGRLACPFVISDMVFNTQRRLIGRYCTWCSYGHRECHCPSSCFQCSGLFLPLFSQLQIGLDPRPREGVWLSFYEPHGRLLFQTVAMTVLVCVCVCKGRVGLSHLYFWLIKFPFLLVCSVIEMHWPSRMFWAQWWRWRGWGRRCSLVSADPFVNPKGCQSCSLSIP